MQGFEPLEDLNKIQSNKQEQRFSPQTLAVWELISKTTFFQHCNWAKGIYFFFNGINFIVK
jgi:hypothetical protein